LSGWEELSDWYDEKQGDTGDLWHRALIDPVLLRLVGDPQGKDILDLGCGNGYLSRRLSKLGGRLTALDSSEFMIANAKKHDPDNSLGINYIVSDAAKLDQIKSGSFDIVFANMSLMDIERAEAAISEVGRVLRTGGRFVASISHPCFDNGSNSAWVSERNFSFGTRTYRRIRQYRVPNVEKYPWKLKSGEIMYSIGYHRPLNWYARVLASSHLAITALEEPGPQSEFLEKEPDAPGFLEAPLHLVIEAVKI
jgi:ubiquinone/menaquinone biosynthesis C-methylase UbiE